MSSANRGGIRSPADFYETPSYTVDRLLEEVSLPGGRWLEPGAGNGAIIKAVGKHRNDVEWHASELRDSCREGLESLGAFVTIEDYLKASIPEEPFEVAIGNPPYSLAEEFIHVARKQARVVVFLLRLNFLASQKRAAFMKAHTPDVYVLPNRPSFINNKTDSCEYAWFVWDRSQSGRAQGVLKVLNTGRHSK